MTKSNNSYTKRGSQTTCSINGCDSPFYAKALCRKHYERVTTHGNPNIRNGTIDGSEEERFWSRVAISQDKDQCWEWAAGRTGKGYGIVYFYLENHLAHRVSWKLKYGQFPERFLLHSCDNPGCVNPRHLREGTQLDNMRDKVARGRQARGEMIGVSKLTKPEIFAIRSHLQQGNRLAAIARRFGVSASTISRIGKGETWSWLKSRDYVTAPELHELRQVDLF